MEQSTLKRYNEIHVMLWEEVLKVFSVRTNKNIEYYKANQEQIETLYIARLKRKALFNLFVRGEITEQEKDNLLEHFDCAACYVANIVHTEETNKGLASMWEIRCWHCPIKKWNNAMETYCNDYNTVDRKIKGLTRYMTNCTIRREKFNQEAYTSLRKAIIKKMYIVAHLEWGYEENGE